ncbi:MAG: hypothetical protein ACYC5F_10860 [Thermoleophilia bacterium]
MKEKCPFEVGDAVKFTPSERTRGLYQNIERFGLKVGQEAIVREVRDGIYLYFDDGAGGFPWKEFSLVKKKSASGY